MNLSKYLTIFITCIVINISVLGQDELVPKNINAYPIETIKWNEAAYSQVKIFDSILSNHNILILSEGDHGQGGSYDAQCMILKQLIDSGKIHSVYIESSWMNCDKIMSLLKEKGKNSIPEAEKYMRSNDLLYWLKNGFWNYLANKIIDGKVVLHGFDIDGVSPLIAKELFDEAAKFKSVKIYSDSHSKEFGLIDFTFKEFQGLGLASMYNEDNYKELEPFVEVVLKEYQEQGNTYRIKQWQSILDFFYWMYKRALPLRDNKYDNQPENDKQRSLFHAIRDSMMAKVFLETYEKEKGEKVVLSMSAYHALRKSYVIEDLQDCCKDTVVKTMGDLIDQKLGSEIYNVCFVTASGTYGVIYYSNPNGLKVKKPVMNSLEFVLNKNDQPYSFVDLESPSMKYCSFYLNAIYDRYLKANWSKCYSGVFFIKEMYPLNLNRF